MSGFQGKICSDCLQPRNAHEFFPSRYTNDGLTRRCKKYVFDESSRRRSLAQDPALALGTGGLPANLSHKPKSNRRNRAKGL
jgi:hypothetical protein